MQKLIIDTDIGVDVDDAIALAYAALSKETKIEAVTTTYGNVLRRAQIAKRVLDYCGCDTKIAAGLGLPLTPKIGVIQTGLEEKMVNNDFQPDEGAAELIVSKIMQNKNKIDLVCIAPLTNIAAAILHEPEIVHYTHAYVMGGSEKQPTTHNFKCDPEAAKIVIDSGMPLTFITTDICKKVYWTLEEIAELKTFNPEFTSFLRYHARLGMDYMKVDVACLYDPLTVSAAIGKKFVKFEMRKTKFMYPGNIYFGWGKPAEVSTAVDAEMFKKHLASILLTRKTHSKDL